jgi:hypothetical protein
MSAYTVTSIPLAKVPNVHNGTGDQHDPTFATVVPASVPGSGQLMFVGADVRVTTMLYQLNSNVVVPNWFGVAVPDGIQDFTRPNIFFHPTPGQAGYVDADYPTKAGLWPNLFYYMERLGKQMAGAARDQIVIMPFLTNAATNTGILPQIWHDTFTDILTQVRAAQGADDGSALTISQVVVSSFSAGIIYSHFFRALATDLAPLLAEIWDFDGGISSYATYSAALETDSHTVIQYDSSSPQYTRSFHVPWPRWAGFYNKNAVPKTASQVHPLIRDFMFLHAASISEVGALIVPPAPVAAPQAAPPAVGAPLPSPAVPVAPAPVAGPVAVPAAPVTTIPVAPPFAPPVPTPRAPAIVPSVPAPLAAPGSPIAPAAPETGAPAVAEPAATAAQAAPLPLYAASEGGCCVAIAGIVAAVATTTQAAITAITAIASLGASEDGS